MDDAVILGPARVYLQHPGTYQRFHSHAQDVLDVAPEPGSWSLLLKLRSFRAFFPEALSHTKSVLALRRTPATTSFLPEVSLGIEDIRPLRAAVNALPASQRRAEVRGRGSWVQAHKEITDEEATLLQVARHPGSELEAVVTHRLTLDNTLKMFAHFQKNQAGDSGDESLGVGCAGAVLSHDTSRATFKFSMLTDLMLMGLSWVARVDTPADLETVWGGEFFYTYEKNNYAYSVGLRQQVMPRLAPILEGPAALEQSETDRLLSLCDPPVVSMSMNAYGLLQTAFSMGFAPNVRFATLLQYNLASFQSSGEAGVEIRLPVTPPGQSLVEELPEQSKRKRVFHYLASLVPDFRSEPRLRLHYKASHGATASLQVEPSQGTMAKVSVASLVGGRTRFGLHFEWESD